MTLDKLKLLHPLSFPFRHLLYYIFLVTKSMCLTSLISHSSMKESFVVNNFWRKFKLLIINIKDNRCNWKADTLTKIHILNVFQLLTYLMNSDLTNTFSQKIIELLTIIRPCYSKCRILICTNLLSLRILKI